MATNVTTPIGRLVQGSLTKPRTTNDQGQALTFKKGPQMGQPRQEFFFAIAIEKSNPEVEALRRIYWDEATRSFPNGEYQASNFSWKYMDGDGVDENGKANSSKPGFAGCWVFKYKSSYAPQCYRGDQQMNPAEINTGDYIRVFGNIEGNGGGAGGGAKKNGLYANHTAVMWMGHGERIVGGPDGREAFKAAPTTYRPAGMSDVPVGAPPAGAPGIPAAGPGMPAPGGYTPPPAGYAQGPAAAAPAPSYAPQPQPQPAAYAPAPAPQPPAPMPAPAPAAPQYVMTPAANGYTREQYLASGYTDAMLIERGMMQVAQPTAPGPAPQAPMPGSPAHNFAYGQGR